MLMGHQFLQPVYVPSEAQVLSTMTYPGIPLSALIAAPVVVSPEGHGIQCHRTWEALYAGAVPVLTLTDSPIDRLYDGLPSFTPLMG